MSYDAQIRDLAKDLSVGRVLQVHPDSMTASVYLTAGARQGATIEAIVRAMSLHKSGRAGTFFVPENGDEVFVDWRYGATPMITDHVPEVGTLESKKGMKTHVTPVRSFGGEDKFHKGTGSKYYRNGPTDLMPGDKVIMGKLGNFLGVLSGGLTILKGGALSQIILSKYRDFVKVIARNFELFTDFGRVRTVVKDGVTSFEILGNATPESSNKHHDSNWDYVMRLGGKNLLDLQLMRDRFQFTVRDDGHILLKSAKSATIELNSPPEIRVKGSQKNYVDGHGERFITGNDQKIVRGTGTEKVGRKVFVASGAVHNTIGGPGVSNYMRTYREIIRGTSLTDTDTIGKEIRIGAGDHHTIIGNPLDLGTPSVPLLTGLQMGSWKLDMVAGDFDSKILTKGDYKFFTTLGKFDVQTLAGNIGMSTLLGKVDLSTLAGLVSLSTKLGNATLSTEAGNVEVSTKAGEVDIKAVVGKIKLTAGTSSIEIGPAGIKIINAGFDLVQIVNDIITNLASTATPGYGGPITTAPAFGAMIPQIVAVKGI